MSKANFDGIYGAPDPRPYYRMLSTLDYQIPGHGAAVFNEIGSHIADTRGVDRLHVADLCCSYGINAAAMNHDASFAEIVAHYTADDCAQLDRDDMVARDRAYFEIRRHPAAVNVIGLDVSEPAVTYAIDAGLLDGGSSENLEAHDPSPDLTDLIAPTDLVTVTGGIGYITERTISRVIDAAVATPWIAALSLRWVDFDGVADAAAARGMTVERLDDITFPQRRFADDAERAHVLDTLDGAGIDPTGREADGYHHAVLYLLQPVGEPLAVPLAQIADQLDTR